jgi:hypothetical protein
LNDGRVLIAGGYSGYATFLSSAELHDLKSGTFSQTGSMTKPREDSKATLLTDGRVLITGGSELGDDPAAAELYEPSTGTFAPTGSLATPEPFIRRRGCSMVGC